MDCIAYIVYIAIASVQRMASAQQLALCQLNEEEGRQIIKTIKDIMKDLLTMNRTTHDIGNSNVIIMTRNSDGTPFTYKVATHIPDSAYPLKDEHYIYPERTLVRIDQHTSIFEVHWNIRGCQSFHDPRNTDLPHILVDGVHIMIVQIPIPTFNNVSVDVRDYGIGAEAEAEYNHDDRSNDGGNRMASVQRMVSNLLTEEYGRSIVKTVDDIMKDPSTTNRTPGGIGNRNVITVILKPDRTPLSYRVATYAPNSECPVHIERYICGVNWIITRGWHDSSHNPCNTELPHILVDGIHILIFQIPTFNNDNMSNDGGNGSTCDESSVVSDDLSEDNYGADDDESSWGEGSVVSNDDLSEADMASYQQLVLFPLTEETGQCIINYVDYIMKDPSTTNGTPIGIGQNNVIIVILNPDGTRSYTVAIHAPGSTYPLEGERYIHREQRLSGTNQYISVDGVHWVIEGCQCFHDPCNTDLPHILVDGIHIIIVQIPIFNNVRVDADADDTDGNDYMDYGADDDGGSSWGEGSVISEGDLSDADTESVVSENGNGDNGHESIDEIRQELPDSTIAYIHQNMNSDLLKRYISLIRGYSEKKRWIRWYVFFANGNRLHTNNDEFLHIARILKFAVWTCSQHSGIFEGLSYDDCVKHIVNAICEE